MTAAEHNDATQTRDQSCHNCTEHPHPHAGGLLDETGERYCLTESRQDKEETDTLMPLTGEGYRSMAKTIRFKSQGYNARLDESLGARNPGKKKQSLKARRDESKGMSRATGGRAYGAVRTMDR